MRVVVAEPAGAQSDNLWKPDVDDADWCDHDENRPIQHPGAHPPPPIRGVRLLAHEARHMARL